MGFHVGLECNILPIWVPGMILGMTWRMCEVLIVLPIFTWIPSIFSVFFSYFQKPESSWNFPSWKSSPRGEVGKQHKELTDGWKNEWINVFQTLDETKWLALIQHTVSASHGFELLHHWMPLLGPWVRALAPFLPAFFNQERRFRKWNELTMHWDCKSNSFVLWGNISDAMKYLLNYSLLVQ